MGRCCKNCLPYKDARPITAQVLSIVGVLLSLTSSYWSFAISVLAFLFLQLIWCCKMKNCGFITTSILCLLAGCTNTVDGVFYLISFTGFWRYYYDNYTLLHVCEGCHLIMAFIAAFSFLVAGTLLLSFTCSKRFHKMRKSGRKIKQPSNESSSAGGGAAVAGAGVAAAAAANSGENIPIATTTATAYVPDGSNEEPINYSNRKTTEYTMNNSNNNETQTFEIAL